MDHIDALQVHLQGRSREQLDPRRNALLGDHDPIDSIRQVGKEVVTTLVGILNCNLLIQVIEYAILIGIQIQFYLDVL